jgi:CheY-like chemotaxis protein/anti-sigma regulatory factor (Ser/Thr protein kinase)
MARVLVIEDSTTQSRIIQLMLEAAGHEVTVAQNGQAGIAAIRGVAPDVVLTDLQMPGMSGLEVVEAVRRDHPNLPVMLMTAHGSEEIAIRALRTGAANYVSKAALGRELVVTLADVLSAASTEHRNQRLFECLQQTESVFLLGNDAALIPSLTGYIQNMASRFKLCDENGLMRLGIAVHEAVTNAMYHGNLEVSSQLRQDSETAFEALVNERRGQPPYGSRRVCVRAQVAHDGAVITVRDEGPGFNVNEMPDPTDPENLEKPSGRGLMLIRLFLDEVRHNAAGNEITLIKRSAQSAPR